MKTISRTVFFNVVPAIVFRQFDNPESTGMHMTGRSKMMGTNMQLTMLSKSRTGKGSRYRWKGRMMFLPVEFTTEITGWVENRERHLETVGVSKMIIYSWYSMDLSIVPAFSGCKVELSISYLPPENSFGKFLCSLFGDFFCRWCIRGMLKDIRKTLNAAPSKIKNVHYEISA